MLFSDEASPEKMMYPIYNSHTPLKPLPLQSNYYYDSSQMPYEKPYTVAKMGGMPMNAPHATYMHGMGPDFYQPQVYKRPRMDQESSQLHMMHYPAAVHPQTNLHAVNGLSPYQCGGPCCYGDFGGFNYMGVSPINYMAPSYLPQQPSNLGRLISQGVHQSHQHTRRRDVKR